ncbi:MAG: hypothetical protein KDD20_07695 [Mangrovimonas sp.]|nr:hypothetical protein [Mangrovimonas sp.]
MKTKLTFILLLITAYGFGQDGFVEYKKEGYSIKYPKDWRLDTSGQMNTLFILFSPNTENDTFNENINFIIQDLTGQNMDLESYTKLSEDQIKTMVPNGKWIESKRNGNHQEVVWSGFVANNNLKFKQFFYVKDDKAYILTFTALETTFDDYINIGSEILNSFQLN